MSRPKSIGWGLPVGIAVALGAAALFATLLLKAQALPTGVVEIAWDKEACAHCRMHVGEKGFASQLQLTDGRVLNFDDPGCLFSWLDAHPSSIHAIYAHHHLEDRWLTPSQAGFLAKAPTPMGFGLVAVDVSTPGAIGWDQAAAQIRSSKGATP